LKCTCLLIEEYFPGCDHLFEDFTLRQWALKLQGIRKAAKSVSLKICCALMGMETPGQEEGHRISQLLILEEKGRGTDDQLEGPLTCPIKQYQPGQI
jgi:hypothetical protein